MKLCELKIQSQADREKLASILVEAGYKVSLDIRQGKLYLDKDYYVIVESKDDTEVKT